MTEKKFTLFLLQILLQGFVIKLISCQDITLNLNTKKIVATTSDKFISLTIDPAVLLTGDVLTSSTELSTNMAKAFTPGYVRLAGPRSNSYSFERSLFPQNDYQDPDLIFSEAHWVLVQQWAQRAGLEIIASLAPKRVENEDQVSTWDSKNSVELISFSDHMGYNMSWQLGYECQTRVDVSGFDLGKDIARLKNILHAFPRYSNSIIAGPDIVSFRGKVQHQFIQDYLNAAGNSLSVITWHPDFAGIALDSDGVALQTDTLAADKDLLYKAMGRSASKKALWIAESKPEQCKQQFLGALVWARRLGNAAKLGVQVIMRQPDASSMFHPTPDYWVSYLHKMLVGKEVLDAKLSYGNKTHVHFYCQCTKQSSKYDKGAITIFGINLTPGKVTVSLKGLKIKTAHKYIIMPGYDNENRMFAETVLLNDEPLTLVNGKYLPEINPAVASMGKNMAVKLPSGGIGFWVIPGARVKSCLGHDDESGDKNLLLKKLTKKLEDQEITDENVGQELEADNHQDPEAESAEDIKSFLKSKKKKVVSKYRHNDDQDEEDRRFKRIDTKREFEKLEKLLKRNNNNKDEKNIQEEEEDDEKEDKVIVMRFKENEKLESGEEIRAKLEEYKNKLSQYETRKKINDKNDSQKFDKPLKKLSAHDVDSQKAIEALALISKVEEAIRENGKSNERIKYEGTKRSSFHDPDIGEEMLIQELERSDKTKRMIDQKSFGKLYEYLLNSSHEKSQTRKKRDLVEKLLYDDPLGLRKDGLFKKRAKIDDVKERRLERRNRKREKEDIGLKKEHPSIVRLDPRNTDSNENNFYGFPQMKPIENFPQGDVFLSEGSSSEEKSHDYDYVKDDDEDDERTKRRRNQNNNRRSDKSRRQSKPAQDETWVEEPNSNINQMPNEFFEKFNAPVVKIKTQWKDYAELYEPESVQATDFKDEIKQQENETFSDAVILNDRHDERQDRRAKETAVKKLINYYDNSEVLANEPQVVGKEKLRPKLTINNKFKSETQTQKKLKPNSKPEEIVREDNMKKLMNNNNNNNNNNNYEYSEEVGSMEFVSSKADEDYTDDEIYSEDDNIGSKKRPKRKLKNLNNDAFGQEMINEDVGNLKDCKCRVIRSSGKLACRNCRIKRKQRDVIEKKRSEETIAEKSKSYETPPEVTTETSTSYIETVAQSTIASIYDENDNQNDPEASEKSKTDLRLKFASASNDQPESETDGEKSLEMKNDRLTGEKLEEIEKVDDENKKEVDIEENISSEELVDDIHSKRDAPLVSAENSEPMTGTKILSGTGDNFEKSSRSDIVGGTHKNVFDLRFKSETRTGAIKNDSVKNKLSSNSESLLSELFKDKEIKRSDVKKAIESSAKLKSCDNTKYLEYQRKQAEKLTILKEKLRERKARILQQYRQELIEALNKCDSEVERNLKRREIWNNFKNQEEFKEFIDNDKVSYLIMNRPVNYEHAEEQQDEDDEEEDRRYYPEIELVQPIRRQRERRISSDGNHAYFHCPKTLDDYNFDQSYENDEIYLKKSHDDDDSYYAFVENLENPKILSKKQFDDYYGFGRKNHVKLYENGFGGDEYDDDRLVEKPIVVLHESVDDNEDNVLRSEGYWNTLIPEYHDGIMHHRRLSSGTRRNRHLQNNLNDGVTEIPSNDNLKISQTFESPCSDGECGDRKSFKNANELEEAFGNDKEELSVEDEPIESVDDDQSGDLSSRIGRDVRAKRSNYICLKENSKEDSKEIENRVYKLIKNDDHYEAVPMSKITQATDTVEEKKVTRRVSRNNDRMRNKSRKYNGDVSIREGDDKYYLKNGKFLGKSSLKDDEIDYRFIGDEVNRLDSDKYELLMLIPVKKHKSRRHKRDLSNNIERLESNEDMTEIWSDIVDIKESEKRLKEYVDAKQKTYNDFQAAQANLNWYLQKLKTMRDPMQIKEFDKFVANLGSHGQDEMEVVDKSQDDVERILLGEYLKQEVSKTVHDGIKETAKIFPETTTVTNLFDATIPKLESTINNELEKVGSLTESLENFINEFDTKFNATSSSKTNQTKNGDEDKRKGKISYNIFQSALNSVKKFFDFLTGVSLIFRRH